MPPHARRAVSLRNAILPAVLFVGHLIPHAADAGLDKRGRWTQAPHWDWGHTAVQLVVLPPGNSGYDCRVLWWEDAHAGNSFQGGMWGWDASETNACTGSASTGFTELSLGAAPPTNVFCSGLGVLADSRVLVAGGTEFGEVGIDTTLIFDPDGGSNKWTQVANLSGRRWYPSVTRDTLGRLLVSSGSSYVHLLMAGGRTSHSSTAATRALKRLGLNLKGTWETPAYQSPPGHTAAFLDWPSERADHAFAWNETYIRDTTIWRRAQYNALLFGGDSLASGSWISSGVLRQLSEPMPRRRTADYGYEFLRLLPAGIHNLDLPRSGHTMVPDNFPRTSLQVPGMIVFGGRRRDAGGSVLRSSDVWHVWWDSTLTSTSLKWRWSLRTASGMSDAPSARFGHAAIYDPVHKRMLVWGGTTDGSTPINDATVYALDLTNPDQPGWSKPTVLGSPPSARFGHRMLLDNVGRRRGTATVTNQTWHYRALLHGGATGSSASDRQGDLWSLWIDSLSTTVKWQQVTYDNGATPPVGRMGHVFAKDDFSDRLVVAGGEVNATNPDAGLWSLALPHPGKEHFADADSYQPKWSLMAPSADTSVTGAAAILARVPSFTRLSDRYDASGTTKTTLTDSPLLEFWYPQHFLHTDGSIIAVGAADTSWRLPPGGGAWECYPSSACATNLRAGAAVMYRPGKVMMCGSADNHSGQASKDSRWNDFATASSTWRQSVNQMAYSRVNHNLVLLPNGKVLALGGTEQVDVNALAVKQPEIWDPDVTSGGLVGQWSHVNGADTLARHDLKRGYHSAAALLPSGQVLLVGGNNDEPDQHKAEVYCPPYLFKADGTLVPRPRITGAPAATSFGKTFTVCVEDTTGIRRAVLLSPAATTHGFDQNQRFIELSVARSPTEQKLYVTAPSSGRIAPPGYYMLFLLGKQDGATHYPDVPSIATWIRVSPGGSDTCDAVAPSAITDLAVDVISPTAVYLSATAPGDDAAVLASGAVSGFWTSSNHGQTAATFAPAGGGMYFDVTGLAPNTSYEFAFKTRDDGPGPNWSGISNAVSVTTSGGGGGGGYSLESTRGATTSTMFASGGGLIVETAPVSGGGWMITLRRVADIEGFDDSEAGSVVLQSGTPSAGWQTHRKFPAPGEVLELCALRSERRTLVLGGFTVQRIATRLDGPQGALELGAAVHSRLGGMQATAPDPLPVSLAIGEELVLTYAPDPAAAGSGSGFATVGPDAAAGGSRLRPGGTAIPALPDRTSLLPSIPNPFSNFATIGFELPRPSTVRIEVFDLLGRRVRTLTDRQWPAGRHAVTWDRTTDRGDRLSSGVYLCRMTADGFRDQSRIVLVGR